MSLHKSWERSQSNPSLKMKSKKCVCETNRFQVLKRSPHNYNKGIESYFIPVLIWKESICGDKFTNNKNNNFLLPLVNWNGKYYSPNSSWIIKPTTMCIEYLPPEIPRRETVINNQLSFRTVSKKVSLNRRVSVARYSGNVFQVEIIRRRFHFRVINYINYRAKETSLAISTEIPSMAENPSPCFCPFYFHSEYHHHHPNGICAFAGITWKWSKRRKSFGLFLLSISLRQIVVGANKCQGWIR